MISKTPSNLAILLIVCVTIINGQYFFSSANQPKTIEAPTLLPIKGRLLTPAEGCGFSKVSHKKIVGGAPAKNGN